MALELSQLTTIDASNCDISNGSSFNNISDDKLLNCLIFWNTTCTVCATNSLYVSTVVLAASSITTFLGLK